MCHNPWCTCESFEDNERRIEELEAAVAKYEAATKDLRAGDGVYYLTQERAMAPGIADGWPDVIKAPHTKNGRLVKRVFALGE